MEESTYQQIRIFFYTAWYNKSMMSDILCTQFLEHILEQCLHLIRIYRSEYSLQMVVVVPIVPRRQRQGILREKHWHLPIWEGVRPFLPSLKICSFTSSAVSFNHVGTLRRYGSADWEIPLLKT